MDSLYPQNVENKDTSSVPVTSPQPQSDQADSDNVKAPLPKAKGLVLLIFTIIGFFLSPLLIWPLICLIIAIIGQRKYRNGLYIASIVISVISLTFGILVWAFPDYLLKELSSIYTQNPSSNSSTASSIKNTPNTPCYIYTPPTDSDVQSKECNSVGYFKGIEDFPLITITSSKNTLSTNYIDDFISTLNKNGGRLLSKEEINIDGATGTKIVFTRPPQNDYSGLTSVMVVLKSPKIYKTASGNISFFVITGFYYNEIFRNAFDKTLSSIDWK